MAAFRRPFSERAKEAVESAQADAVSFKAEILKLEDAIAEKKAALELAQSAIDRFDSFVLKIGGKVQCPDCWILRGVHADMIPIESSNTRVDWFRCRQCHLEAPLD
ncbi:MAG: hypothetical protein TEF_03240 [Rhizobiales bacterium NRL2]|jgi:hypothetical protein|nr:MAG: hypothetical protein TEF_03240 [Rhizobiales bacterium NRL2]